MILNKKIKLTLICLCLTLSTVFIGQGCGNGFNSSNDVEVSSSDNNLDFAGTPALSDTTPAMKIIPNTKTVSISYSRQIVDSMVSCTGIKQSTVAIKSMFEERKGSLSEFGHALEISAPMLMAGVSIAGEVCNQLVTNEEKLPAAQRRIFKSIDFSRAPTSINATSMGDVVRRIAHSCWSRKESTDELDILTRGINEAFSSNDKTTDAMLMLCTGMLSSLTGLEI